MTMKMLLDTVLVNCIHGFSGSNYVWFGANLQMDGRMPVAAPQQEALGVVGCHSGCAPFLDDDIPSPPNLHVNRLDKQVGVSAQHQ